MRPFAATTWCLLLCLAAVIYGHGKDMGEDHPRREGEHGRREHGDRHRHQHHDESGHEPQRFTDADLQRLQAVYSLPSLDQAERLARAIERLPREEIAADYKQRQQLEEQAQPRNHTRAACTQQPAGAAPSSVHRLRPRDIQVVGAIGDSLTAAFGAKSWNLGNIRNWLEYRGVSFSTGGDASLDTVTSLANVIRFHNPNAVGFSTGDTPAPSGPANENAGLNQARSGAVADDLPPWTMRGYRGEAYNFTTRARALLGSEFASSWKLLTFFIGSNNLCWACNCPICNTTRHETALWRANVGEALAYLRDNVPRLFVALILPIDVTRVYRMKNGLCASVLEEECACGVSDDSSWRDFVTQRTIEYQNALEQLASQYDTNDFAVVVQPFLKNTFPPNNTNGNPDKTYFAPDCFHFAVKAHAAAAVALWDNLIKPVGEKLDRWYPGEELNCAGPDQLLCSTRNRGTGGC